MSVEQKRKSIPGSQEASSSPEHVAKKICLESENYGSNSTKVSQEESNSSDTGLTILDVLNEDCLRMIFDYVPLRHLIQSDTVSKQWQMVVIQYLKGLRICLRNNDYVNGWYEHPMRSRIMYLQFHELTDVVKKLGRCIVGAYITDFYQLETVVENCPDLEDLKIIRPDSDTFLFHEPCCYKLKNLKRVSFQVAVNFDDEEMVDYICSPVLEELVVDYNNQITGRFIKKLKSDLKALRIDYCRKLNVGNLASAAKLGCGLSELTKLGLNRNPTNTMRNVYKLIQRTPKLECLTLETYEYPTEVGGLVDAICRLSRLTHLSLLGNINVCDEWLEPIGRSCKQLRSLNIGKCKNVSEIGLRAFCRTEAAANIIGLDVSSNEYITHEDVVFCIRSCPKLEYLNVRFGRLKSNAVIAAAAAATACDGDRPRLRLRLNRPLCYDSDEDYALLEEVNGLESLTLDRSGEEEPDTWALHYIESKNENSILSGYELYYYCDY